MEHQVAQNSAESKIREVAERIIRLREDLGLTAEEMAEQTESVSGFLCPTT